MSNIKSFNTEVANLVGIQASLVLNYLKWWVEEKCVEKVYRTNAQISEDLNNTLSESQIQRAKKKLVDGGMVIISHDRGHLRTTHYTLTEKAKGLLGMLSEVVAEVKEVVKKVVKKVTPKVKKSSMEESFKNQGDTRHAIPIPADVLEKLKGFVKPKPESVPEPVFVEEEDDISEEDYFSAIDFSMAQCQEKKVEEKLSFSQLMSKAFSQVPNIEQFEKNRNDLEMARNYKEDY